MFIIFFFFLLFQAVQLEDDLGPFDMEIWRCFFTDTTNGFNICELEIKHLGHLWPFFVILSLLLYLQKGKI